MYNEYCCLDKKIYRSVEKEFQNVLIVNVENGLSLFSTMNHKKYRTRIHVTPSVFEYIETWYNSDRIHPNLKTSNITYCPCKD